MSANQINIKVKDRAYTRRMMKDFEKAYPGFKCTRQSLTESYPDGSSITRVVFKGSFTPFGMCRDCGDHYIIAKWTHYARVDKATLQVTRVDSDQ